jgi:hypothetical protein
VRTEQVGRALPPVVGHGGVDEHPAGVHPLPVHVGTDEGLARERLLAVPELGLGRAKELSAGRDVVEQVADGELGRGQTIGEGEVRVLRGFNLD